MNTELKLSKSAILEVLDTSCTVEDYMGLTWRQFLREVLRLAIQEGVAFKGTYITGGDDWYWELMKALTNAFNPSNTLLNEDEDPETPDDSFILQENGILDQVLDVLMGLNYEQGCDCPQSEEEAQPPQETPSYKDISTMSIDEVRTEIQDWVFKLKDGDEVFVMYSPLDWQVSDRSYMATINRVTDSRVRLAKPGDTGDMVQFHRKSGLQVKGVDSVGDYRLIPPWLNPKDLEEAWMAMEVIRRNATLAKIPTAKLIDILRQIETD